MTTEQLKWTDKEWAAHLGCAATDIPRFKKYLKENFSISILADKNTGWRIVEIQQRHDTPSGNIRYIPMVSTVPRVASAEEMTNYANNKVIPSLILSDTAASIRGVPTKILQMLHINKNQK